jgi:hypothetical protein
MKRNSRPLGGNHQRGFAIMVLLALLAVGILYAVISLLDPDQYKAGRAGGTGDALAQAKAALIGYAATYRDNPDHSTEVFGYLPCPDTADKSGIQVPGDGEAAATCSNAGETVVGLLPYKTLGLPELRDSSGNCLWYAVSGSHKNNPKTAPLNWDTQGLIKIQDVNGNVLDNPDDPIHPNGGAVAVIFAAGPPLPGQSRTSNAAQPCNVDLTAHAKNEYRNYLDGIPNSPNPNTAYTFPIAATVTVPTVIVQGTPDIVGAVNNDRLVGITSKEIFDEVVRRADFSNKLTDSPVGQINKLADLTKPGLELNIQHDLEAGGTVSLSQPDTAGYTPISGKQVGGLGALSLSDPYATYATNWSNEFRQVVCSPLTTCLSINGTKCRGALMFGGRAINGQPRPSVQQTPSTANLDYYFEAGSGREILNSTSMSFIGNSAYVKVPPGTSPSADFANCLFPGAFVSFAQDIATFAGGTVTSAGAGSPVEAVDTAAHSATLGSTVSGPGTARSGCIWYPSAIPLNSMLRVYFRFQVVTRGTGFTFAIADAATNNPFNTSPIMCGATGTEYLGYAGPPPTGVVAFPLNPNKPWLPIAAVSWSPASGGTATVTTVNAHGLSTGDAISIRYVLPAGYNADSVTVTVLDSTRFTYALPTDPGPSPAGIKAPKLAVEFDTHSDASRVDPTPSPTDPKDHIAFVYWGGAGDSTPSGSGLDDNVHYAGVLGDGTQPLNPGDLGSPQPTATPITVLLVAPWSAAVVPGTGRQISAASWSATGNGTVTVTTSTPHGLTNGQYVNIANVYPAGYNGTYQVTAVADATHFAYALATSPGNSYPNSGPAFATDGRVTATAAATKPAILAAVWNSGTVTVTTATSHGFTVGQDVIIAKICAFGYNGKFPVTAVGDAKHFTYSLATDPGGAYSATTGACPGIETASKLQPTYLSVYPAGSDGQFPVTKTIAPADSVPENSDIAHDRVIQVRVDISRTYDATAHRATLTMTAYVADTFQIPTANTNPCTISHFKNLSQDLADLCTQSVYIEQDGIPINDTATSVALTNATWNTTTHVVTATTGPQSLRSGQMVNITGAVPSAYNGSYQVIAAGGTTFTYFLTADPGGDYVSGGTVAAEALSAVYFGFTTGRSSDSTDNQNVVVSNLLLRSQ